MFKRLKKLFSGSSAASQQSVNNGAIFIDVRTPAEFNTDHLPGAQNIPLDILYPMVDYIKQLNKPVITVCRTGARSAIAEGILTSAGIHAQDGGAWTNFKK
jgi:phage shock protein E